MLHNDAVTIKDVAEKAGVSTATAARVMGNYGSTSEKTQRKVIQAARSLSYVPNAIAKSMRKHNTRTIGIIIGNIQAPFFSKLACAIENVADRAGYNVLICNTNERPEKEIIRLRSLFERRVDGIIVSSAQPCSEPLSEDVAFYYSGDTPVVMVDRKIDSLNCPLVQCDNIQGSYKAAKYLLELGHRKIGVLASNQFISSTRERIGGFKMALADYGLDFDEDMIRYCQEDHVSEVGPVITQDLLDAHPEITALYLLNNPIYKSAWIELKMRGARIAKDISLLGWGDVELAEAWDITVVTQPIREIGVCAAEMLVDMIENKHVNKRAIFFETALIHRSSCARPRTEP